MKRISVVLLVAMLTLSGWAATVNMSVSVRTGKGTAYITFNGTTKSTTSSTKATVNVGSNTATFSIRAVPDPGYRFVSWSDYGTVKYTTAEVNGLAKSPSYITCYMANFEEIVQDVTVSVALANGCSGMGTVSGGKTVTAGQSVTITAVPAATAYFKGWSTTADGSAIVSTSASYTVAATNATYYAVFGTPDQASISENHDANGISRSYVAVPQGAVDLGLPSGLLWADRNVGASEPGYFGDYFAWGDTKAMKAAPEQSTYAFKDSQYDSYYTLPAANDAATQNLGAGWRMPTRAEFQELMDHATWTYGVYRWNVSGNGNTISFPFCGMIWTMYPANSTDFGRYWTSSKLSGTGVMKRPYYVDLTKSAYSIKYDNSSASTNCYVGYSIRPVCEANGGYLLTINARTEDRTSSNTYRCTSGQVISVTPVSVTEGSFVKWTDAEGNTVTSGVNPDTHALTLTVTADAVYTAWFTSSETPVEDDREYIYQDDSRNGKELNFAGVEGEEALAVPEGAVDMGLSVYWASSNLGASSPEQAGDYYAWAETATKTIYNWEQYRYSQGGTNKVTKYSTGYQFGYAGFTDNKTVLDDADEVVKTLKGGNWRMPTPGEYQELLDQCTWQWGFRNHVYGYTVTAPNGKTLFLPASGYQYGSEKSTLNPEGSNHLLLQGTWGYYWTNTLDPYDSQYAKCFKLSNTDVRQVGNDLRRDGLSVRPVCPAGKKVYTLTIGTNQGDNVNIYKGFIGQTVTITVSYDAETYIFRKWSDGNTDEVRTFTISGNTTCKAIFEKKITEDEIVVTDPTGLIVLDPEPGSTVVLADEVKTDNTIRDYDNIRIGGDGGLTVNTGGGLIINHDLTIETGGKLIVEPGATVVVNGTVLDRNDDGRGITVCSNDEAMGQLLIDPVEESLVQPMGSVQLYTVAGNINGELVWQHFGIPTVSRPLIETNPEVGSWYYFWDNEEGWINGGTKMLRTPFMGYNLTNESTMGGVVYTFTGKLVGNAPYTLNFDREGWILFANSYTSSIYVENIMNSIKQAAKSNVIDLSIQMYEPVYEKISYMKTITYADLMEMKEDDYEGVIYDHILPMQAFFLRYRSNDEESLVINYADVTRNPDGVSGNPEAPRRAPRQNPLITYSSRMYITVTGKGGSQDEVKLRESGEFTDDVRSEYNAEHQLTNSPSIFVNGDMAYSQYASTDLLGTAIGFNAGTDTEYTLSFSNLKGTTYALRDMQNGEVVKVVSGNSYTFNAEPGSHNAVRFMVVEENATPTALSEPIMQAGIQKVLEDGQLYIFKNGQKYNVLGTQLR